jgi:3-oxoacyl-[acyl-carrier-protein] synthase II
MERIFDQSNVCLRDGYQAMDPLIGFTGSWDEAASEVSMHLKLNGPSHTVCSGCASSTDAIGLGFRAVQRGEMDLALVGGTDAPISTQIISSYKNLGLLTSDLNAPKSSMRPFDLDRNGFVLGEGAAFLVLENFEKAKLNGRNIYAEIVGYGNSCDAYHHTARDPLGNGLALAISNALKDAEARPTDIDYINLHGTATFDGDRSEAYAVRKIFTEHARDLSFGFSKPMIGHMQGACGVTEAAISVMAIHNKQVPPIPKIHNPDPECQLNLDFSNRRNHTIETALNLNSGFGGKNAVLIFRSIRKN